jgi:hypothetical protein
MSAPEKPSILQRQTLAPRNFGKKFRRKNIGDTHPFWILVFNWGKFNPRKNPGSLDKRGASFPPDSH